jgi:hypothetical protein
MTKEDEINREVAMNIEDLKCCGNCDKYEMPEEHDKYSCHNEDSEFQYNSVSPHHICSFWVWDELKVRKDFDVP